MTAVDKLKEIKRDTDLSVSNAFERDRLSRMVEGTWKAMAMLAKEIDESRS